MRDVIISLSYGAFIISLTIDFFQFFRTETNDFILTTDYEYRKYKFDYNGKNFTDMSQF